VSTAVAQAAGPIGIRTRSERATRTIVYLFFAVPLAVGSFLALPTLVFGRVLIWRLATLERRLANTLLHARVAPLSAGLTTASAELIVGGVLVRVLTVVAAAVAAAVPLALFGWLVIYGAEGLGGTDGRYFGPWPLDRPVGVALFLFAAPAAVVSIAVLDGLAVPLAAVSRRFLSNAAPAAGAVREALVASIGDTTLSLAYWLPDRDAFVDERGLPVDLPDADSGRAWTAVELDGRRVAAIIHDADLEARPELVQAAAAGAVLALDNERLKADLRARVEELRASRTRIVEASIEARRKLERDLHDGAQQHLVGLSLDLQRLRSGLSENSELLPIVDDSLEKLGVALSELRELARGIHPAILTQRGLAAALAALVERSPVSVDCDIGFDERVTPAAEAAAYFVAAEALTNVAKYAQAKHVSMRLRRDQQSLTLEVEDDGIGGADPVTGSGLRGLADRVAALDGTLTITSPAGRGTLVVARIPARAT
jgi:signal transduction histidine kinase